MKEDIHKSSKNFYLSSPISAVELGMQPHSLAKKNSAKLIRFERNLGKIWSKSD